VGAVLFPGKWTVRNDVENALRKSLISTLISDISYLFLRGEPEIRECPVTLPAKPEKRKDWGAHAPSRAGFGALAEPTGRCQRRGRR
jgi:hypothetical protein